MSTQVGTGTFNARPYNAAAYGGSIAAAAAPSKPPTKTPGGSLKYYRGLFRARPRLTR